jgi:DNA replication protein DnaC
LENAWCDPARGLEKSLLRELGTAKWLRNKQNVIIVGQTGVGKTFLGSALAQSACAHGMTALCTRVPRLLNELAIAHADGSLASLLARLSKLDLLVLDDFLIGLGRSPKVGRACSPEGGQGRGRDSCRDSVQGAGVPVVGMGA